MTKFEVIKFKVIRHKNKFIQVSHRRAVDDKKETDYLTIGTGYHYGKGEAKKYMKQITLPFDEDTISQVADILKEMMR